MVTNTVSDHWFYSSATTMGPWEPGQVGLCVYLPEQVAHQPVPKHISRMFMQAVLNTSNIGFLEQVAPQPVLAPSLSLAPSTHKLCQLESRLQARSVMEPPKPT
jgi:hypothetical protein